MRVALLGAGGQLGMDLSETLSAHDLTALAHGDLDICEHDQTRKVLADLRPDVVVNSAAFHQVDKCEVEPERAFQVNAFAVRALGQVCADLQATFVTISTDYVFGGDRTEPWIEEDAPNPLSVYGISKLAGEYFVRSLVPKHLVVRSSGLYGVRGASGKGGNFVETMIRLAKEGKPVRVVDDQVLSPTYTRDLAEKISELIAREIRGLAHVTNSGHCSWFEFARKIFELTELRPDFAPTTTEAYGLLASRPAYSVLDNEALRRAGVPLLRDWGDALQSYLQAMGHLRKE